MPIALQPLSRAAMTELLPEALTIYVAAMGYPRGTEAQRSPVWASHTLRPGWTAVAALETPDRATPDHETQDQATPDRETLAHETPGGPAAGRLRGIAYGYQGSAEQWWGGQVRAGLVSSGWTPAAADAALDDYFELTELHVAPEAQGHGLGVALLDGLLAGRAQGRVLLSTPEVRGEANRAWRLYRRRGFTDLLRRFTFAGDPRPFAVLARNLPL